MKTFFLLVAVLFTASEACCQNIYFNGFGNGYLQRKTNRIVATASAIPVENAEEQKISDEKAADSVTRPLPTVSTTVPVSKPAVRTKTKTKGGHRLKLYDGDSHELTMRNLLAVMEEVGVTNQIIVLAQSLLETGFFTSNVCKTYNNLFGLYDSRNKCYYSFERWEDSVVGYRKFIQYRYKSGNYFAFLKRIGYAEDPQYITKVGKITKKLCEEGNILD